MKAFFALVVTILSVNVVFSRELTFAQSQPTNFANVYSKIKPSVVYIVSTTSTGSQTGSGFIYSSDSSSTILVTANHVIADAIKVEVILDSDSSVRYEAQLLEHDRKVDVAFLKIKVPNRSPLRLADKAEILEGSSAAAIGYPRAAKAFVQVAGDELRPSVHMGTVSAVRAAGTIVQVDAQTDHGDSGGPIVDAQSGNVIGIVDGALNDPAFADLGLEKLLPGSSYGISATTIYSVRNALTATVTPVPAGASSIRSVASSATFRVGFSSETGSTRLVQSMMDQMTTRVREHFTGTNAFYAIPTSAFVLTKTSTEIASYCDDFRINAIVVPYFSWRVDPDASGRANASASMLVTDCEGVPFFFGRKEKTEGRLFSGRFPAKEAVDMENDLIDQLLVDFDKFRDQHDVAWQNLLKIGVAADASPAEEVLVGLSFTDDQYRVWHLRTDGLGYKAGLREGDIVVSIDDIVPRKIIAFDLGQVLAKAHHLVVRRPDGDVVITLR